MKSTFSYVFYPSLSRTNILPYISFAEGTCTDGQQSEGETGIDCGGPCTACPTCNDGIQNQAEINVDCGGTCNACPTCEDGIQNQGETGIDCGGPCVTNCQGMNNMLR